MKGPNRQRCKSCGKPLQKHTNSLLLGPGVDPSKVTNMTVTQPAAKTAAAKAHSVRMNQNWFVKVWDGQSWGYDGHGHFHSQRCAATWAQYCAEHGPSYVETHRCRLRSRG